MKIKKIIIFFPIFNKGGLEQVACTILDYFKRFDLKIYFITVNKHLSEVCTIPSDVRSPGCEEREFKTVIIVNL